MRYEKYEGRKNDVFFGLLVAAMFAVMQFGVVAVYLDLAQIRFRADSAKAPQDAIALHTAGEHVPQIARAGSEK